MTRMYVWFYSQLTALRADRERGAAAVEYGLLVALVAVAVILAVTALGKGVRETFCLVTTKLGFTPGADCGT